MAPSYLEVGASGKTGAVQFPADAQFLPSIIIGWQKHKTIECPPHGTPFTGTGFGTCYGALVDGRLMSFDLITGKPAPVEEILPNHDQFAIFGDEQAGPFGVELERYMAMIEEANETGIAAQALLANPRTIRLATEFEAGAPEEIRDKLSHSSQSENGPVIMHTNTNRIVDVRPRSVLTDVILSEFVDETESVLDSKRQILWLPPELTPLIDCPALEFDAILRRQLEEAFPSRNGEWAIVAKGANDIVVEMSRMRSKWADEFSFITHRHVGDYHDAESEIIALDGRVDLTIEHDMLIAETEEWYYQGMIIPGFESDTIAFTLRDWSHMVIRPGVRYGIVAKLRSMLQITKDICLTGVDSDG